MNRYIDDCTSGKRGTNLDPPRRRWRNLLTQWLMTGAFAVFLMGSVLPATSFAATLNGYKFEDTNNNGSREDSEGYANHFITIRNTTTGQIFPTRTSSSNGWFEITGIPMNGNYVLSTLFPAGKCLITTLQSISFNDPSDERSMNLQFGNCGGNTPNSEIDPCIDANVTHTSVQNGVWNEPDTWGSNVPIEGSRVKIIHEINVGEQPILLGGGGLCNEGTLWSSNGEFQNCAQPATPGDDIVIHATRVTNVGTIRAGDGSSAPAGVNVNQGILSPECYQQPAIAGKGGNLEIYSTRTENYGFIAVGNGGDSVAAYASSIAGDGGTTIIAHVSGFKF